MEGIISYLTNKHGGNVHEEEIVTITSNSADGTPDDLKNITALNSGSRFLSKNQPRQEVRWDFGEMRVLLAHYAIWSWYLRSWVVEGSVDGDNWTEIDRQIDNQDFKDGMRTACFAVSVPLECRFVRLTQMDKNHLGTDYLRLRAVEFFGRLSE
jgi:hypothetical protein